MLRHLEELFYPIPTKIIYCYGEYQKEFDKIPPNVELVEGFSDNLSNMIGGHDNSLLVLDDLMSQCSNDQRVEGETIPNSNISDLVSDAMRSRKDFNPTGKKVFPSIIQAECT